MKTLWNQIDTNVYMLNSFDIKESEHHVYAFITKTYDYYFEKPNGDSLHITHGSCKFDTYASCLAEVRSIFGKPHPSMKDEWRELNGEKLEFSPKSESIWSADVVGVDGAEGCKCVLTLPMPKGRGFLLQPSLLRYLQVLHDVHKRWLSPVPVCPTVLMV